MIAQVAIPVAGARKLGVNDNYQHYYSSSH